MKAIAKRAQVRRKKNGMSLASNFQRWHSIDCTNLNSPVAGEIVPNVSILWMQLKSMSGWPLLLFIFFSIMKRYA